MIELFNLPPFPTSVLIVDDEVTVGRLLAEVASHNGFEPVLVHSAEAALPEIERHRYGAMIVDKNLSGIDGVELMRGMRVMQPYCACIMITAYASQDSAIEAVHLGAADYITKPFDDVFLIGRRLVRAVARHRLEYETQQVREQARALLGVVADAEIDADAEVEANEAPLGDLLNQVMLRVLDASLSRAGVDAKAGPLIAAVVDELRAKVAP